MKSIIIAASVTLMGCATPFHVNECIYPLGMDYKPPADEVIYGWSKAEFAAMPKYCGASKPRRVIVDRSGRTVGYIR